MSEYLAFRVKVNNEMSFIPARRWKISVLQEMTLGLSTTLGQASYSGIVDQPITDSTVFCACFYLVTVLCFCLGFLLLLFVFLFGCCFVLFS